MRKIIVLLVFSVFVFGCKSTSSPVTTKLDNKTEVALKGNWNVTGVTYPGSEYIKVTSFDLVDSKCFVGSSWKFVSNNNKGHFDLTGSGCTDYSSDITWYVNKDGQFVMKILNAAKAKNVNQGYVLKVANISESSFQLIDHINVGGKPTDVVYQFQRIN